MGLENVPRCQHIKVNGTQCGSPALLNRRFCFFHDRFRRERARIAAAVSAQPKFDLPLLEDANSVQIALMKVIQMLGSGQMDPKTAGLVLYALQTASANLRRLDFEPSNADDVVIDRDTVHLTCIDGPQWSEEDFEEEPEEVEAEDDDSEEEDDEEEGDDEEDDGPLNQVSAPRAQPATAPVQKKPPAAATIEPPHRAGEPEKKSSA